MKPLTVTYKARLGQARAWSTSNREVARPPAVPTTPDVPRAARLLALATHVERAVQDGTCASYAAAARALGMSAPRLSQILDLMCLAPDIQEALLLGRLDASERRLREVLVAHAWDDQRARLAAIDIEPAPSVD